MTEPLLHRNKPVWVPIALPADEAQATFNACRAVFAQLTAMGETEAAGPLARAMVAIARACDKAREEGNDAA